MARVARRGTPIVVVDEQLDPARVHLPQHYLWYRALTWLNTIDGPPIDQLPAGATDVDVRPVSRFYYCMKFRMPNARTRDAGDELQVDTTDDGAPAHSEFVTGPIEGGNTMSLTPEELQRIRDDYDDDTMSDVLRQRFDASYPATDAWLDALTAVFTTGLPGETQQNRAKLSAMDRERCLMTLLCSRGEKGTLGIHMYMALCLGVTEDEIKHILFLTGLYSGVPNFARGLIVLEQTTGAIHAYLLTLGGGAQVDSRTVAGAIIAAAGL